MKTLFVTALLVPVFAGGTTRTTSPTEPADRRIAELDLAPELRANFHLARVRTVREVSLLTEREATRPHPVHARALTELREELRAGGTDLGTSPFVFLPYTKRLTLARKGIWTADDLLRAGWTPESNWPKVGPQVRGKLSELVEVARGRAARAAAIIRDIPLDDLEMTVRLSNILHAAGIQTARQLSILNEKEATELPGFNARTRVDLDELRRLNHVTLGQTDLGEMHWRDRLVLARLGIWSAADVVNGTVDFDAVATLDDHAREVIAALRCQAKIAR